MQDLGYHPLNDSSIVHEAYSEKISQNTWIDLLYSTTIAIIWVKRCHLVKTNHFADWVIWYSFSFSFPSEYAIQVNFIYAG